MKIRVVLQVGLLAALPAIAACGDDLRTSPTSPSGPLSLSPLFVPQLEGVWQGPLTLTNIQGGAGPVRGAGALECAGTTFASVIGESNDHTLLVTQSGTSITATLTSGGTGLACKYSGRLGSNATLALYASACEAPVLNLRCQPDPDGRVGVRQMRLVGSTLTATLDAPLTATSMYGTAAHSYNLFDEDDNPIGHLVAQHEFVRLTRR